MTSQILQSDIPTSTIDLGRGNPAPELLPLDLPREAAAHALGLQRQHLERLRQVYAGRLAALDAALQRELAGRVTYRRPTGGFFIWARLAKGLDAETLQKVAQAHGAGFRPGVRFSSQGGLRDYVRLCFAYYDEARLAEGVARLAKAIEAQALG